MQNHYNLVYREEEREMIPLCLEEGLGVIPWSPLARGRLTRTTPSPSSGTTRADSDTYAVDLYDPASDQSIIDAGRKVASELGVAPSEVALGWLLQKPGVSAPIVGATKIEHLESAVRALDVTLSPTDSRAGKELPAAPSEGTLVAPSLKVCACR
jgi:aryl-alcohol dehydrogenase-like predicted oxidoreductase